MGCICFENEAMGIYFIRSGSLLAGDRAGKMSEFTQRTRLLLGDGVERLAAASVAVFGLGGVGSFAIRRWRVPASVAWYSSTAMW